MSFPINAAEHIINDLGIEDPDDLQFLEEIAWARGALVRFEPLEGAEARLMAIGKPAVITISTKATSPQRQRFSIAHELGHFEMHRFQNSLKLCTKEKIGDWRRGIKSGSDKPNDLEQEANLFASALLLPERFFSPLCDKEAPSLNYIGSLAERFNVSLTSTALRYLFFSAEPVAIVWSQENRIRWFQESHSFSEIREEMRLFIDLRSKLDPATQASMFFRRLSPSSEIRSVPASAWFVSGCFNKSSTIKESSIGMPSYDAVLTLLWIDDVIDED